MARVNKDHTVLPAAHTFIHKLNEPYLLLTASCSVTTLWLVLISHTANSGR